MIQMLVSLLRGGSGVRALTVGPAAAADPDRTVFDGVGYEGPAFHQDYLEKHNDSPSFAYFGDEEEAFQRLRAGFKADLGHPCTQSVVKWREPGLLKPPDTSRTPARDDPNPGLPDRPGFRHAGKAHTDPTPWGNKTGCTYVRE